MSATAQRAPARTTLPVEIRWMIRAHLPEVLGIERLCFEAYWTEDDFLACLRKRECIGMVALREDRVVGFMVYELYPVRLSLLNLAVMPSMQGRGIGRQMIERLKDKLSNMRRRQIATVIRETNLDAQLFFKSQGFRYVGTLRGEYDDTEEDGYEFLYRLSDDSECEGR